MKKGRASRSAEGVTFARALESRRPPDIRVCDDPMAEHFLGVWFRLLLNDRIRNAMIAIRPSPIRAATAGYVPLRTRFIDDRLQACLQDGLEQLVILGAGYDSRALRFDELKSGKNIMEVDRPETQAAKLSRLRKLYGSVPGHVTYVSVDFEREGLADKLQRHGYDQNLKTLFVWEGVTYYLEPDAVDQTLAFVADRTAPGSSIIFDYVPPDVISGASQEPLAQAFVDFLEEIGEPVKFGIPQDGLEEFLSERGFSTLKDVSVEQCKRAYHTPAHQGALVLSFFRIVHAAVLP